MTLQRRLMLLTVLGGVLLAGPALAQSVKLIGSFHDWTAYGAAQGSDSVCFAMAKPASVDPSPDGYTQAYLYLTRRPAQSVENEMNLVAGFTFAANDSSATIAVGGQSFSLYTQNDAAWLADPTQGDNLAGAMRAGTTVVVQGTTDKGVKVKETFSLSGATAAYKALQGGC